MSKEDKAWEGWKKNYNFHLAVTVIFSLVFLVTGILLIVGVRNWFTWVLLAVSAVVTFCAAIELPEPKRSRG